MEGVEGGDPGLPKSMIETGFRMSDAGWIGSVGSTSGVGCTGRTVMGGSAVGTGGVIISCTGGVAVGCTDGAGIGVGDISAGGIGCADDGTG